MLMKLFIVFFKQTLYMYYIPQAKLVINPTKNMARSIIFIFTFFPYKCIHQRYENPEMYKIYDSFSLHSIKNLHIQIVTFYQHFSYMIYLKGQEDSSKLMNQLTFVHFEIKSPKQCYQFDSVQAKLYAKLNNRQFQRTCIY